MAWAGLTRSLGPALCRRSSNSLAAFSKSLRLVPSRRISSSAIVISVSARFSADPEVAAILDLAELIILCTGERMEDAERCWELSLSWDSRETVGDNDRF